jgi:hypothetical protein
MKQDKSAAKVAVKKHERAKHPGEPPTELAKGGAPKMMAMKKGAAKK